MSGTRWEVQAEGPFDICGSLSTQGNFIKDSYAPRANLAHRGFLWVTQTARALEAIYLMGWETEFQRHHSLNLQVSLINSLKTPLYRKLARLTSEMQIELVGRAHERNWLPTHKYPRRAANFC